MTPPEIALWTALRRNATGFRFRKQHPAGYGYVLDFFCAPARLVIEVDGEAHARGDRPAHDARRDAWLVSEGLRVVRYAAAEVLSNLDGVVTQITGIARQGYAAIESTRRPPPPTPSAPPPPGGGG